MTDRILLVDDVPSVLSAYERMLSPNHFVITATSGAVALSKCQEHGRFGVVISDYDIPGMKGTELLVAVRERWPDTVGILLTGVADVDLAIRALHTGRIFRFLQKPCPRDRLLLAVHEALEEHRRLRATRELAGTLRFSREALAHLNGALDRQVEQHTSTLLSLSRFVSDLNMAESIQQIADLAAGSVHELVGGRAVEVEVLDGTAGGPGYRATIGLFRSPQPHVELARASSGELGRVIVDRCDADSRALTSLQKSLIASIASALAVAVHNQLRLRERDAAQHATILALAKLAEHRDNETGKHLERVSLYSTLIAEGLREDGCYRDAIDHEFVRDLYRSAPLHDIGKVGVPDSILLKPGKLDEQEWSIMKTHAQIGADTLRAAIGPTAGQNFLRMSLDIAWCHHEFWNGRGYPRALEREDIPLSARIVALADVYDALTSVRVYKPAWSHKDALAWIEQQRGEHFDPRVASAFLERERQADRIRARLADTRDEVLAQMRRRFVPAHAA